MFQDGKTCIFEILYQSNSSINIQQVIIGDFLPVQLIKHLFKIAEIKSLLMRIFPIPEPLPLHGTIFEGGILIPGEIIMDHGIVM